MLVGKQLGPLIVEKEIGSGAMGTVYRARYTKNNQLVALKIISVGLDSNPTAVARFEREMAILKKLNHPNIVRLFGSGRYHGKPFYIMEFVEGESLETLLERRGRFNWEEVVRLGKQICQGLQHAHDQSVVHRDLKPANIMVTTSGQVKLTDFGIAKGLEFAQLTATNSAVGTAAYMSPEQCRGEKDLTGKSDLYSLGVMFYELLTGRRPFLAETALNMFLAHTEGKFERPSRLVLDIPIYLDTLVCHMLEKEPHKRPLNANLVAQSLDRVVEKVSSQHSIGVDAVSSTASDKALMTLNTDAADKETLRHLRFASGKKRSKRRRKPLSQRGWVQLIGILAVLGVLASITWLALRPPSLDKLVRQTRPLVESKDRDDWDRARDGPISEFFRYYAKSDDKQAAQMRAWADQIDLAQRERQFRNRLRHNISPDTDAEQIARSATRQAEAGDLTAAAQQWTKLADMKQSSDQDEHTWGLLGEKRVLEIQESEAREKRISDELRKERQSGVAFRPQDPPEDLAILATRYQRFRDLDMSLVYWRKLEESVQDNPEGRPWLLLAYKNIAELTPRVPHGADARNARIKVVSRKFQEALAQQSIHPEDSEQICHELVRLYGNVGDPDIEEIILKARNLLSTLAGKESNKAGGIPSP